MVVVIIFPKGMMQFLKVYFEFEPITKTPFDALGCRGLLVVYGEA